MGASLRFACLFAFLATAASAQGWLGYLVDGKCYASEERNVNPTDSDTFADRSVSYEIRYCHPTPKSKTFVFIQQNGLRFQFDPAGNAKAAEFVRANGRKAEDLVSVSGAKSGYRLQVAAIEVAKTGAYLNAPSPFS